jgi:isopenicillin N synthase-like dioxygenase
LEVNILKVAYKAPDAPIQFADSLHQVGFAVLTEPPIPRELIDEAYQEWERFFSSEEKHHYNRSYAVGLREKRSHCLR